MGEANTKTPEQSLSADDAQPSPVDAKMEREAAFENKAQAERTATIHDYLRIFSYASKWDFLAYAVGFLASIGAGCTLPLLNVVFGKFVGSFSAYTRPDAQNTSPSQFEAHLDRLALYMFALFIGRFSLNYLNKFAFRMIGIRLSSAIRIHFLRCLLGQSIDVLDSMPPGYAVDTITSTSNVLQLGISEKLGIFVEYLSTMVTAIIVAFTWNWLLTLVTASAILFILLSVGILVPQIVKGQTRVTKAQAKSSSIASEAMAAVRMIMACGAEGRIAANYSVHVDEAKRYSQFISPLIAIQFGLIFFAVFSALALAFYFGTKLYLDGRLSDVGVIIVVLFSVMMVVFSLERLSTPMLAVSKASVAACQFFTVIDAPPPVKGSISEPDVSASNDIVLENVTFAYPSRPHVKVLDCLNMRFESGKITAIVGPSGSGKSTIVGLVEGWFNLHDVHRIAKAVEKKKTKKKKKGKATEKGEGDGDDEDDDESTTPQLEEVGTPVELGGTVSISGHSLDEIDMKWWRSQIGLVQQEPFLFNESIYTNVSYGLVGSKWENAPDEEKEVLVREACQEAFANEFIDKLPEGYDTLVGDSGAKLSGGQRQRIAIARSIVRKPKILILDEATSSIDVRSEKIVQAALDRVARNRTTITIAHRLSTIMKADKIIVLEKGKAVESGTHAGLMAREGGVYARLVRAQALSLGEVAEACEKEAQEVEATESIQMMQSDAKFEPTKDIDKIVEGQERNIFKSFGRLFYESKNLWPLFGLTVLWTACAGAIVPLQAWLIASIINVYQYTGSKLMSEARFWSGMWVVLATASGLSYFFSFLSSTQMAAVIRAKYQSQYFEAILFQKPSFFDEEAHSQGTMTSRAASDPQQLEELMGANMASVYIAIFNICGSIAIAFAFDWKLAFVAICVVVPVVLGTTYWRFKYELQFDKMNAEVFAESSKFASEAIGAFRTVTSLTLEESICRRFEKLCHGHVVTAYKKARWVSLIFGFADSAAMACQALLFVYGGKLLAQGQCSLISFFVVLMAALNSAEAAGQGISFGPNAAQATRASNRILNMRESRMSEEAAGKHKMPDSKGGMTIEFDNVHFKYPTRDVPVFQGMNFTIEKGQFAALVGATGCGKTSIVSLLERFYDVDHGRIMCNGVDIANINIYDYRRHLSLVAQEPMLFRGTIRDNVLLGVDKSQVTDEKLHAVCRDASIHDFVISLPEGYNTNIGSRGVSLSGGQKQRVAIARALMRDPQILLLDEATSSLDSESEKLVQAAFERAGKGRTMVVVAHRLATVQNADVIFVLGEGKLLEKGNHASLLQKKGVYWQMCQSQALDR